MQSMAKTVGDYLDELPRERRDPIEAVREVILKNLPKGYEEGMQYGMIGYYVPLSLYPEGYHCAKKEPEPLPFAGLASQKNHMSFYCMGIYGDSEEDARFRKSWKETGLKLDMGKSCVRFRKLEDVALKAIGQTVKRITVKKFIRHYEDAIQSATAKKSSKPAKKNVATAGVKNANSVTKKKSAKKAVAKKTPAKKSKGKRKRTVS